MPRETRKAEIAACILLLVLSISPQCTSPSDSDVPAAAYGVNEGDLQINVTDDAGRPIQDANITVAYNASYWMSDISGHVLLTNLSVGMHFINASKSGYINDSELATVAEGELRYVDLRITGGQLSGFVWSKNNDPINNATVQISGMPLLQTVSSPPNGTFNLTGIPEGVYVVTVVAAGYAPVYENIAITAGATKLWIFKLNYLLGWISGYVFDDATPVPGASVSVVVNSIKYSVTSDLVGFYKIPGIPSGNYSVTASKEGYTGGSVNGVLVANGSETKYVNLTVNAMPATLFGTVTATVLAGSVLIYGALVEIIGTGLNDTTGTQGNYEILNVPVGTYTIRVSAPGYNITNMDSVTLAIGQSVELNVALTPKPGQLTGVVRGIDTLGTLAGYKVTISGPEQRETLTNDHGQYVFAGLTPGNYTITVAAANGTSRYSPYIQSGVIVQSEGSTTVNVLMTLVKQSLGGFIFGMDLPHSFMVLAFFMTIVILTLAAYLRLKRIQNPEKKPDLDEDDLAEMEEKKDEPPLR